MKNRADFEQFYAEHTNIPPGLHRQIFELDDKGIRYRHQAVQDALEVWLHGAGMSLEDLAEQDNALERHGSDFEFDKFKNEKFKGYDIKPDIIKELRLWEQSRLTLNY